jgi:2',3'-cyclic-nucleotide 2'-phosphodiesterase (5'-nucleotidase family)
LGQTCLVKKISGFTIGIIGLVSPLYFSPDFLDKEGIEVKDPEATLKEIFAEGEKAADIIILLAHLGKNATPCCFKKCRGLMLQLSDTTREFLTNPKY